MCRILYITNLGGKRMAYGFSGTAIAAAHALSYEFYSVANRSKSSTAEIEEDEKKYGVRLLHVDLNRNPFSFQNISAYKQLCRIIQENKIKAIHCNTPTGGLLGRLAGKKCRVKKVIYQTHGFHFYKGAPLLNWLLYYPVEKWLARYTDALITINQEDYALAKRKMKLRNGGKVYYVPGVGVDIHKFTQATIDKAAKRRELGIPEDAVLLLSVGELNNNKNHETIIRAIADMNVYYIIAGRGELHKHLENLIDSLKLNNRVKLLGFRSDVKELYEAADMFVFPSFREGLSISLMEAMAAGVPIVASRIRGNVDLIEDGVNGFLCDPQDVDCFTNKIRQLLDEPDLVEKFRHNSLEKVKCYDKSIIAEQLREIYCEMT